MLMGEEGEYSLITLIYNNMRIEEKGQAVPSLFFSWPCMVAMYPILYSLKTMNIYLVAFLLTEIST